MMKIILGLILMTAVADARLYDTDRQFIEHDNILENPSFVYGKAGWSVSTGSFSVTGTGRDAGATWDPGASGETLCSSLVPVPARMDRSNGYWSVNMQSGVASTFKAYVYDGTNVIGGEVDLNYAVGSYPAKTSGNFIFPATGSVQLCIESQADEVSTGFYNAYLGDASNLTDATQDTAWLAYTPTFTGFGTAANIDAKWKRQGEDMLLRVNWDCGTPTAVEARVSLPGSFVSSSAIATTEIAGFSQRGAASALQHAPLIEASVAYVTFAQQGTGFTGLTTKRNGNDYCSAGNTVGFSARVPIAEWSGSVPAFKADQTNRPWTAYTPTFTGFGTAASIDCQYRRQGQNAEIRCLSNSGTPTATEARVSLPGSHTSSSELPATISVAGVYFRGATATSHGGAILIEPSVAYVTLSDSGAFSGASVGALSKANGSSVVGTGETWGFRASVQIQGWNETMNAPLIKHAVVTSSNSVWAHESVSITNSGTPTLVAESGDWTGVLDDDGTGDTGININSGIFSAAPNCVASNNDTSSGNCYIEGATTTSEVGVQCVNTAGAATDLDFTVICHGPR